jgi:hypothetical protein
MDDWAKRIKKGQDENEKRAISIDEINKINNKKIREFVEKEVYPAFDEIIEKYPGEKWGFRKIKNLVTPMIINGTQDKYEWKFGILFEIQNKDIYVSYIFDKFRRDPINGEFEGSHISIVKKSDILNKFADLVIQ